MLPSLFALLSSRLFTMESFVNTTLCSIKTKVGRGGPKVCLLGCGGTPNWAGGLSGESQRWIQGLLPPLLSTSMCFLSPTPLQPPNLALPARGQKTTG